MLTGKQRSLLKGMANRLTSSVQIGKIGLSDAIISDLDMQLENRELIKINVLNNSPVEAKEIVDEILEKTGAEFVQQLGNKLVIYRESEEHKKINLE